MNGEYKWFETEFDYCYTAITNNGDRILKSFNKYDASHVYYVDHLVKGWRYPITVQVEPTMTRFIAHRKNLRFNFSGEAAIKLEERNDEYIGEPIEQESEEESEQDEVVEMTD